MPKQDKVQIINQRRRKPTDSLGLGQAIIGGGPGDPATITLETENTSGATHTHKLEIGALVSMGHIVLMQAATGELVDYGVATEDGLTAALAAAIAGDVVWLPAGIITGDHVAPAGVTLRGLGLASVLTGAITGDGIVQDVQRSLDYANQVLDTADHTYLGDVSLLRQILAGDGLIGGGDLTEDRTLAVGAGAGITVTADAVAVDQAFSPTWTGQHTFQDTMIARTILPELTDAYDLGSAAKLWRRGYLSELRALLFAEETIQLVGGWLIIPKDAGTFAADVADTDTAIDFGKAMTPGHWVLVRSYNAVTNEPAAEYVTVGTLVSGTIYNVTRDVDGSGANDWAAGTPFLVLGADGDGRIELNAYDTPRIQILQQGAAYNLNDEMVRIGDLNGSFGITNERYGLGVGDYAAKNYLRYDPVDGFLLQAGGGEITIDDTGITIGYDADVAFRLEADSGGTKHDVMYHDAGADALHIESATRYWELMEAGGAKWAMDGDFVKGQARPDSTSMALALGDADNNWGMLSAHDAPGVILNVGTGSTPTPAVDWREHRLIPSADNAKRLPEMVWIGAETNATKYLDFLYGAKYLWANLSAFNVNTGAAIAHCVCEIARPGSGNTDRYFTSDRTYLYGTSGDLYLRLRSDGFALLYNTSAAKVRWVGWVMYYSA